MAIFPSTFISSLSNRPVAIHHQRTDAKENLKTFSASTTVRAGIEGDMMRRHFLSSELTAHLHSPICEPGSEQASAKPGLSHRAKATGKQHAISTDAASKDLTSYLCCQIGEEHCQVIEQPEESYGSARTTGAFYAG